MKLIVSKKGYPSIRWFESNFPHLQAQFDASVILSAEPDAKINSTLHSINQGGVEDGQFRSEWKYNSGRALDWLVEEAFKLGREYAEQNRSTISANKVAKEFFGYQGLPDQQK